MTEERIDDAALNVERYILAKVNGDADKLRDYLCSEMENEWEREAHSFDTVTGVSVQNLSCKRRGIQEIVDCQGEILANYGGEQRIFPVGTYRIVWEASSWKWCGELEP